MINAPNKYEDQTILSATKVYKIELY